MRRWDTGEPGPEGWPVEPQVLTWPGPRFESHQTKLLARRRLGQLGEGRGKGVVVLPALTGHPSWAPGRWSSSRGMVTPGEIFW